MTTAFYFVTEAACCSLFVRTFAAIGGSTVESESGTTLSFGPRVGISTNPIRVNRDRDGTQLQSGSGRNAIAALAYDPTLRHPNLGHFIGQLATVGYIQIRTAIPSRGHGSGRVTVLTLVTVNTIRGEIEARLDISEFGEGSHTFTTAFQIIALEEGTITETVPRTRTVDPFNQFVVVHGFGRSTGLTTAGAPERIALSVFTTDNPQFGCVVSRRGRGRGSQTCSSEYMPPALHARNFIT